jgi:hypothetical protein
MSYASEVIGLAPVAYWKMNETSGTNLVDVVGSYAAALEGTYTLGVTGLLTADADLACTFASSSAARTGYDSRWVLGTGDFSVSTIIKFTNSAFSCFLAIRSGVWPPSSNILVILTTSRIITGDISAETWCWDTVSTRVRSPIAMNDGNAHHVVVTYQNAGQELRLYVDGWLVDTRVQSGTRSTGVVPRVSIGNNDGSDQPFIGTVDETCLFNYELSDKQVANLASAWNGTTRFYKSGGGVYLSKRDYAVRRGSREASSLVFTTPSMIHCGGADQTDYITTTLVPFRMWEGTIEAWIKTSDKQGVIVSQDASGTTNNVDTLFGIGQIGATAFTDGRLTFETQGTSSGSVNTIQSTIAVNDNQLHHVAIVVEGTTFTLIIDGQQDVQETGKTVAGLWGANGNQAVRFCVGASTYTYGGMLGEVRIWNRAKSVEQIRGAMYQKLRGDEQGLVGYWPCDEVKINPIGGYINFDSTSYLTVTDSVDDFKFNSGDFTVEGWFNFTSSSGEDKGLIGPSIVGGTNRSWHIGHSSAFTALSIGLSSNGTSWDLLQYPSWGPTLGTWYHIALVRNSTTVRVYVNGSQIGSNFSFSGALYSGITKLMIGCNDWDATNRNFPGKIAGIRISKGIARYTSSFTPIWGRIPSDSYTKLLIHPDGGIIDLSTSNHTINRVNTISFVKDSTIITTVRDVSVNKNHGTVSGNIEGLSNTVAIEPWLGTWKKRRLIKIDHSQISSSLTNFPIKIKISSSSGLNSADIRSIFTEVGGNSKKIAVTTSDKVTQCYVEVEHWDHVSQVAVLHVKVPSVSSTSDSTLYLYYDSGQLDNTFYVGDMKDSRCLSFDGDGDYLELPYSADFNFGSGDFTIETWFKPSNDTRMYLFSGTTDYVLGLDFYYQTGTTRTIQIWASSNGTTWDLINGDSGGNGIGTIALALSTWHHVAFVRNGNRWMTFINGMIDKDITVSGTVINKSEGKRIGRMGYNSGQPSLNFYMTGSISNYRVSNVARYTSNFAPPKTISVADTNTKLLIKGSYIQDETGKTITTYGDTKVTQGYLTTNLSRNVWDANYIAVYHPGAGIPGTSGVVDSTTNALHGTAVGMTSTNFQGTQADFDGSTSYINAGINAAFQPTNVITVESATNLDVNTSSRIFAQYGKSTGQSYGIGVNYDLTNPGKASFSFYNGAWRQVYDTDDITTGVLHHIAGRYDGTTLAIVVDGTVKNTSSYTGDFDYSNLNGFNIGAYFAGSFASFLDGKTQEVRMSNIARSDAWVKATAKALLDALLSYGPEIYVNSSGILLQDSFQGVVLDSTKWATYFKMNATATVADALQLNNQTGGSAWTGAHVCSDFIIPKKGVIKIEFDWFPHSSHYSSASTPGVGILATNSTRESYYGIPTGNSLLLFLGYSSNAATRTHLQYWEPSTSQTIEISINMSTWHHVTWTVDWNAKMNYIDLDYGTTTSSIAMTTTAFNALQSAAGELGFELFTADYGQNNTERFKNLIVRQV